MKKAERYANGVWVVGIAIIVGGLILETGCASRSLHSAGHSQFGRNASSAGESSASPSSITENSLDPMMHSSGGGSGEQTGEASHFDLMVPESIETESPIAGSSTSMSAHDYWEARRRAELTAAQHGVKDVHFPFDSWQLTKEAKRRLAANAKWLKSHPNARVTIEGHCDERGTRAYNYILGEKRAMITRNYLAALGVPPRQMMIQSYGKDHPICRQDNERCYAKNRRAHFLLGFTVAAAAR